MEIGYLLSPGIMGWCCLLLSVHSFWPLPYDNDELMISAFFSQRFHLTYHTRSQVLWGFGVGCTFGALIYTTTELVPRWRPQSGLGRLRMAIVAHPISTWFRLKDGWSIWADGGQEEEWQQWKIRWDSVHIRKSD